MLDLSRRALLIWAASLFALCALIGIAAINGWPPVSTIDLIGRDASTVTAENDWVRTFWRVVEVGTDWYAVVGVALLVAAGLFGRYPRAAVYVLVVVVITLIVRFGLVLFVDRKRPTWQTVDWLHESPSYPSGHATGIAVLAGVIAVVVTMFVRRRGIRRLAYTGLTLLVLLVAADRVFLGRHFPSDVVGGIVFAAGAVFLGMAIYTPLPASHSIRHRPLVDSVRGDRRIAVVLNPIKVESVEQFKAMVTTMATEAGWKAPTWHLTTVDDPGTGMARAAQEEGADLVLVCGGDGTVREVCSALAGTGIAVGIVPGGTGNLLARNLSIPLYIRAAIDVALTGQDRAIDLVEVSGDNLEDTNFLVMAGMGFDAAIMSGVNEDIKKRIGWMAYVLSALKSLMFPSMRLEISVDDSEFTKHRARTVVVGNVGYLQANMPLLPEASLDDGLVDVVLLYPQRFWSWLPLAFRVLSKQPRTDDLLNRMTGRSVVIRTNHDQPRQLDGDTISEGRELRMECVPGRLLVRVPR
ncbi:YegS/Rv2252/BmrU family lipid kinase [Nocardioides albertanoniae]|uniref:YegS/Rv2252/BmrU family lipid kinase n=1 Tax=Nocardioides albertanoniae TaxID=1175486 RepID=A0A543A0Q5_9ACTN|nr:YegS/Rv2252/BmrU family lipid kinase [Nocardioides albertanoniae]TQL66178.1 YegS/Rv2252/BmrU family lipid kinase [Nocardioides albertanoniae]